MDEKTLQQAMEENAAQPPTHHVDNFIGSIRSLMPTIRRSIKDQAQFADWMGTYIEEGAQLLRDAGIDESLIEPAVGQLKKEVSQYED